VKRGLSQAQLAGAELSTSYVSLLESGRRQPTAKAAAALAERLGVEADFLLRGEESVREERELQLRFAQLALANGDVDQSEAALEQLRAGAQLDEGESWTVDHLHAQVYERRGDMERAIEMLESLRERAERDPARYAWLQVVIDLSRCYREAGDLNRAVSVAEQAIELARSLGLSDGRDFPRLVVTLAGASRERGDHAYATQLLNRLLLTLDDRLTRRDRGSALWNAAVVAAERGAYSDGLLLAERALAQFAEEEDVRAEGMLRTTLAWMLLDAPAPDAGRALQLLQDAHERLSQAGMQIEVAYTETELARAHASLGDADEAIRWAQSALHRLGDSDRLESARARLALARALLLNQETAAALHEMQDAATALEACTANRQAAAVWRELAELFVSLGDLTASSSAFSKALELLGMPGHVQPAGVPRSTVERPESLRTRGAPEPRRT
jgi:tetratricopeptide (TPR) repeat protein